MHLFFFFFFWLEFFEDWVQIKQLMTAATHSSTSTAEVVGRWELCVLREHDGGSRWKPRGNDSPFVTRSGVGSSRLREGATAFTSDAAVSKDETGMAGRERESRWKICRNDIEDTQQGRRKKRQDVNEEGTDGGGADQAQVSGTHAAPKLSIAGAPLYRQDALCSRTAQPLPTE